MPPGNLWRLVPQAGKDEDPGQREAYGCSTTASPLGKARLLVLDSTSRAGTDSTPLEEENVRDEHDDNGDTGDGETGPLKGNVGVAVESGKHLSNLLSQHDVVNVLGPFGCGAEVFEAGT